MLPWAKYAFTPSNGTFASGRLSIGLGNPSEILSSPFLLKNNSLIILFNNIQEAKYLLIA